MAGSITVQGLLTATSAGTVYVGPYTLVPNTAGNYESLEVTLASGANTINVPSWAVMMLIIPPQSNGVSLALKGVSGDNGLIISPDMLSLISFSGNPPASFVITAASAVTGSTTVVFS